MIDLEQHVSLLEQGADCTVDLGEGNQFTLKVKKASIRDPEFFRVQEFIQGLAKSSSTVDKLKDLTKDPDNIDPAKAKELADALEGSLDTSTFPQDLSTLCEYTANKLVTGWDGVTVTGSEEPREFDRKLVVRLFEADPTVAIKVFVFSMSPSNYGTVAEDAEKN